MNVQDLVGQTTVRLIPCSRRLLLLILKKLQVFGQIYKDLLAHSEAEEQSSPSSTTFYGDSDTQELYDEQAQLKQDVGRS